MTWRDDEVTPSITILLGNSEQVDLSVCGRYVVSKGGQYVVSTWSVCGWYVVGMWLVRGRYVVGKGGWYVVSRERWCGQYMVGPFEMGKHQGLPWFVAQRTV